MKQTIVSILYLAICTRMVQSDCSERGLISPALGTDVCCPSSVRVPIGLPPTHLFSFCVPTPCEGPLSFVGRVDITVYDYESSKLIFRIDGMFNQTRILRLDPYVEDVTPPKVLKTIRAVVSSDVLVYCTDDPKYLVELKGNRDSIIPPTATKKAKSNKKVKL